MRTIPGGERRDTGHTNQAIAPPTCGGPATALVSEFAMQNSLSLWERVGVRAAVRGDAALTRASRDLSQKERCDPARSATGLAVETKLATRRSV